MSHSKGSSVKWIFICSFNVDFHLKVLLQMSHPSTFTVSWIISWFAKILISSNVFPQVWHSCDFSLLKLVLTWFFKLCFRVKFLSQISHLKETSLVWIFSWIFLLAFWLNALPQNLHWNGFCLVWISNVCQSFLSM